LAANAVDADLKPYYDYLVAHTAKDSLYAGFKLIRQEQPDVPQGTDGDGEKDDVADDGGESAPDSDASGPDTLYWFFFPLAAKSGSLDPSGVVAWEASSRGGRATYFFRVLAERPSAAGLEAGIHRLNRVLGLLNFRRRPIYLSDDELERDPKFHRYAIAARRMPEVREVRAAFLGRAIHSSLEAWQSQVKTILAKAGIDT
jgi:hypothetical protein